MQLAGKFILIWSKLLEKCTVAFCDMKGINVVVLNFLVLLTRTLWEIYCFIPRTRLVNLRKIFPGGLGWSSRAVKSLLLCHKSNLIKKSAPWVNHWSLLSMMQCKVKKVFQTVMYTTNIAIVSFLGNRNHNIIFLSWQLFVFISLVINAEIFKMIVDRYN